MFIPFIAEEIIKANAENKSDAGEGGKGRVELAVLELAKEGGREAGVAAELDQTHRSAQTEVLQLVADVVFVECFFEVGSDHAVRPFLLFDWSGSFSGRE
jgi:hypothetical protein